MWPDGAIAGSEHSLLPPLQPLPNERTRPYPTGSATGPKTQIPRWPSLRAKRGRGHVHGIVRHTVDGIASALVVEVLVEKLPDDGPIVGHLE